jgi:hypothetical protein
MELRRGLGILVDVLEGRAEDLFGSQNRKEKVIAKSHRNFGRTQTIIVMSLLGPSRPRRPACSRLAATRTLVVCYVAQNASLMQS